MMTLGMTALSTFNQNGNQCVMKDYTLLSGVDRIDIGCRCFDGIQALIQNVYPIDTHSSSYSPTLSELRRHGPSAELWVDCLIKSN